MREPERIDRILSKIKKIWQLYPDQRFHQLVSNLSNIYSARNNDAGREVAYSKFQNEKGMIAFNPDMIFVDLFYLEDDKFEMFLDDHIKELGLNKEQSNDEYVILIHPSGDTKKALRNTIAYAAYENQGFKEA